jgi:hypothetical protein
MNMLGASEQTEQSPLVLPFRCLKIVEDFLLTVNRFADMVMA